MGVSFNEAFAVHVPNYPKNAEGGQGLAAAAEQETRESGWNTLRDCTPSETICSS